MKDKDPKDPDASSGYKTKDKPFLVINVIL